jgi:hypothetical protein
MSDEPRELPPNEEEQPPTSWTLLKFPHTLVGLNVWLPAGICMGRTILRADRLFRAERRAAIIRVWRASRGRS